MKERVSVFLPTRKGSERVKNKNTRPFAGIGGGLLHIKLQQLLSLDEVDEIVLSTNDPASIDVARQFNVNKLKIVERPAHLALSSTDLKDLINYVPSICNHGHILWTHVTSPLTGANEYRKAISEYFNALRNESYDSLMSGKWFQNFLWSPEKNEIVNKKNNLKWPRTQDLAKWFEVDSAIFLASKGIYIAEEDRVGNQPFLFNQDGMASFDVDWEDDFRLAEMIYQYEH